MEAFPQGPGGSRLLLPTPSGQAQLHFRLPFWPLLECPAFPLCIFSVGGGLGAGNPVHILSPPSLWRTKLTRAEAREAVVVWGRLLAHRSPVEKEIHAVGRGSEVISSQPMIIAPSSQYCLIWFSFRVFLMVHLSWTRIVMTQINGRIQQTGSILGTPSGIPSQGSFLTFNSHAF